MIELQYLEEGVRLLGTGYGFDDQQNGAGILGFGYGLLVRNGTWTDDLGLVLLARRGAPGFPYEAVNVTVAGEERQVPCCVFLLDAYPYAPVPAGPVTGSPDLCLGAPISRVASRAEGTWACFSVEGNATLAFSAAHVFAGSQAQTPVYCGARQVGELSDFDRDIAVIGLRAEVAGQARSETPDGIPIAGRTKMSWRSIGVRGVVYCPTRGVSARPRILAGGMSLHLLTVGGRVVTQRGAIMTEGCTQPGDSGTGLITPDGFAVGVLSHGRKEFSFFEAF